MSSYGPDKAVTIRMPATANLMIDSADRDENRNPSCWDFQIVKNQSIQNGFFTRVGTTEVVLEWCEPNLVNEEITFDISGASIRSEQTITFAGVNATVYQLLNAIADLMSPFNGCTFSVTAVDGFYGIDCSGGAFSVVSTPLAVNLGLNIGGNPAARQGLTGCTDIRKYRYIDITCPQLTYAQDLKDNSTQDINRDVLCRWYFAEDTPENVDAYGFPILQGYLPFVRRRIFNPPKQIKWDNNLPLGNLSFQVYDEAGDLLPPSEEKSQFLMTLQLSEN